MLTLQQPHSGCDVVQAKNDAAAVLKTKLDEVIITLRHSGLLGEWHPCSSRTRTDARASWQNMFRSASRGHVSASRRI